MTNRIQGMGKSEAHLDVISLSWAYKIPDAFEAAARSKMALAEEPD
jgi:hypothetical protein